MKEEKPKPDKLEKLLDKHNLTEKELNNIIKQSSQPKKEIGNVHVHYWGTKHARFGIISDTHIGHEMFRTDIHEASKYQFKKEKVDCIYHAGDIIEGMSNREGHIYELEKLGVTPQVKYASEIISDYDKEVYFIAGNHDQWAEKKSNQGIKVGEYLESLCKNAHYLGDMKAQIKLADNVKMDLTHEGTSSYALSYSSQKRINAIEPGKKPHIKVNGHIHKAMYMFYRNIHSLEAGTLCGQTDFMAMKGSPAHTGFWILDIYWNKKGLNKVKPTFFPFY